MDTWVMGGRVAGPRTISTSPININYCSKIEEGRVDGILRPSPTSTTNTKMINSMISRERVDGILRPISPYIFVATIINSVIARLRVYGLKINIPKSYITCRHCKNSVIINTNVFNMVGGIIYGLTR